MTLGRVNIIEMADGSGYEDLKYKEVEDATPYGLKGVHRYRNLIPTTDVAFLREDAEIIALWYDSLLVSSYKGKEKKALFEAQRPLGGIAALHNESYKSTFVVSAQKSDEVTKTQIAVR